MEGAGRREGTGYGTVARVSDRRAAGRVAGLRIGRAAAAGSHTGLVVGEAGHLGSTGPAVVVLRRVSVVVKVKEIGRRVCVRDAYGCTVGILRMTL